VYIDPPSDSNGRRKDFWKKLLEKLTFKDRPESTQAYLDFMRPRCVELARVLKPTGSFYYHCDWDAIGYIRAILDPVFGESNFINEFRWKRSDPKDAAQGSNRLGRVHGTLLLYSGDSKCYFQHLYRPGDDDYVEKLYTNVEPETGRRYRPGDLVALGGTTLSKGKRQYEFLGVTGYWRLSKDDMQQLYAAGRIHQTMHGAEPHFKRYLDEIVGVPIGLVWNDIPPLQSYDAERLASPTQEPLEVLERMFEIFSQPNNAARDASSGCGTALVAAFGSKRQWIGIGHFTNVLPLHVELDSEDAGANGSDSGQVLPKIA